MPHFGLMDENELGPVQGPLQRARLHIRGGRRRLRQGKTAAGIVTLADALSAAMQWYLAAPRRGVMIQDGENLNDDRTAYAVLVRSGVLDGSFDYDAFDRVVERALQKEMRPFDHQVLVNGLEQVMTQLGVMPFDESSLPPEDPATF